MTLRDTDPALVGASVESVRNQVYERWELWIADTGSTDRATQEALAEYANDPKIRVVGRQGDAGSVSPTNAALEGAQGEFVAFMAGADLLKPHTLAQVVTWLDSDPSIDVLYTDEDKVDLKGQLSDPHLKPEWSPDLLMSTNYIGHLAVIRRSVVQAVGGLRSDYEGDEDYDLILRVTERTDRIAHIPEPLYSRRTVAEVTRPSVDAAKCALADALERRGINGWIEPTRFPHCYRTRYAIPGHPRVAIIIPTKDGVHLLKPCIESIFDRSTYDHFEIVVVDNQSTDRETLEFLARSPVKVVEYPHRFNYSRLMNFAAASVEADALVLLNNDTQVISRDWLEAMLEHAMRPDVGAVGARLYYADGSVQHEGVMVGVGWAMAWNVDHRGYLARGDLVGNVSAVTGACMMMRSTVYRRVGGYDERLRIGYNDVDICLRLRQAGLEVVYTPYAELYHYEGATRGREEHQEDGPFLARRWRVQENLDPYYSPLFARDSPENTFVLAL